MTSFLLPAGLCLALLLTGCAGSSHSPSRDCRNLPRLMVQRLQWMDEVAQVKQARSLPVTDATREAELLIAMEKQGTQAGLPAQAVRAFFTGQIEAAKQVQKEWLQEHPSVTASTQSLPDLATTVRPALDALGKQMITELVKARQSENETAILAKASKQLIEAGFSQAVCQPAVQGLEQGLK